MSIEIGMRELRNGTSKVLEAVETGEDVFLTNHGVRVARITPIVHVGSDWPQRFDARDATPQLKYDSKNECAPWRSASALNRLSQARLIRASGASEL